MALGKETGKKMRFHISLQLLFMVVVWLGGTILVGEFSVAAAAIHFFIVAPILTLQFREKFLAVKCPCCDYNYFGWRAAVYYSPFWASNHCRNCGNELP